MSLAVACANQPEVFAAGVRTLTIGMGLANTVALLTGSYCAVRAVTAIKAGATAACGRWLLAGAGTGAAYVVIKMTEYVHLFMAGYTLRSSTFYFFYFFMTFFHLMHVVLGMIVLIVVASRCRRGHYLGDTARGVGAVESGASYWYMMKPPLRIRQLGQAAVLRRALLEQAVQLFAFDGFLLQKQISRHPQPLPMLLH